MEIASFFALLETSPPDSLIALLLYINFDSIAMFSASVELPIVNALSVIPDET